MQQMKATAAALREQLQLLQIDKENSVQREHTLFADETTQLRATIQALRDQLEAARHG
jgi:hypothetical protein